MNKKVFIVLLICTSFVFTSWGKQSPKDELWKLRHTGKDPNSVVVMTRNIYVGGDVDRVVEAENPSDIPILAALTFQEMLSTDFHVRAEALVDEIERSQPHLIGLQEISLIRYQSPGDAIVGGEIPAEIVLFDYFDILMTALANRGLDYYVVGSIQDADVEVPMLVSPPPNLAFDDIRLTDFDVLLARSDVTTSNVVEKNYAVTLEIPGTPIVIPRGYVAANATVGHKTYRVASTHLESYRINGFPYHQLQQAAELIADMQSVTRPIILLGDFNTFPGDYTYQLFESSGYVDAWTRNQIQPESDGFTTSHDADLRNTEIKLNKRIDLILVKSHVGLNGMHNIGPVFSWVVGDELSDRVWIVFGGMGSWIWPSDHAGVIALLRIPILGYNKTH